MFHLFTGRNVSVVDIYWQMSEVAIAMSDSKVRRWVRAVRVDEKNFQDQLWSDLPSVITQDLSAAMDNAVRKDRRFTTSRCCHWNFQMWVKPGKEGLKSLILLLGKYCAISTCQNYPRKFGLNIMLRKIRITIHYGDYM